MKRRLLLTVASALISLVAQAADETKEVHVIEETLAGGARTQLRDQTLLTGGDYTTQMAPAISGQIFTHWSISRTQTFVNRDRLGRAKDSVTYHLYEPTTLTANYRPTGEDTDLDGVEDGWEIYWYGDLSKNAASDTDGDGMTFAEELAAGTNPLIPNGSEEGGIVWDDGELLQYNLDGFSPYTIRSEPEGVLFATITDYALPGVSVTTPTCNHLTTKFAYWTCNGVRVQDRHGRTLDGITFVMPNEAVEYVAVCVDDVEVREQYYWYGKEMSMTSDSDGDGLTLAEEIAAGTNPLIPNESVEGGIVWDDGELLQYNIDGYQPYTIRSEPEGALFATVKDIVKTGTALSTPVCNHSTTKFAYWTLNGVRQQDRYGRAYDQVNFAMPDGEVELVAVCVDDEAARQQRYWYGATMAMTSDTDGDGMTLAEEVAAGTNPLIPNESVEGGIVWDDSEYVETDLQVYEQVQGAVVDGTFTELFTSPILCNGTTSSTFGANLQPVVADVNGDGLFDVVLVYDGGVKVLVNVGGKGNPEFEERSVDFSAVDLAMNSTEKLDTLDLDTPVIGALSATVWGQALLASDGEGRIWYYTRAAEDVGPYQLQHKVWGGSYAGFAQGLRLAAVDWDDDGDLDCLCGTVEGKLMLLRDPKVGRPTNVKALVGVDNVLLDWDPNAQSRVRGYRVYRADAGAWGEGVSPSQGGAGETPPPQSNLIAEPQLPRYRDYPPTINDFDYRITSVSRHYVAGNSTPIESESMPTEAVRVEFGKVKLAWNDAAGFDNEEIKISLAIENSLNVAGDGLTLEIAYDAAALKPVRVETSGLTEGVVFTQSAEDGMWTVRATGGKVAAGGGTLITFVFEPVGASETGVSVRSASMKSVGGATIPAVLPEGGAKVTVAPFVEPEPAHASITMTESVQVTAGESFEVVVAVSGEGVDTASLAYDFSFDTTLFTRNGNVFTAADVAEAKVSAITLTNVSVKATDGTAAVVDSVGSCAVAIAPQAGGDVGNDGDETDDPEQGVVYDKDGELVDWGDEPQEGSAAYGFGFRLVNMSLGSVRGKTDEIVEVPVGIHAIHLLLSTTVDVSRWAFSVSYDADLLEPVGIAAVQGEYDWSATNGVMTVVGKNGKLALGKMLSVWQYPLKLKFRPVAQYARHDADLRFKAVQGRTVEGKRIYTPVRASGGVYVELVRPVDDPTVVVPYGRGDVTGDGRLAKDDLQLMAQLMQSKKEKWNDRQLGAGDYNGNGKLDNDDYQLMRADFRAKGIVNGGEKMGVL